MEKSNWDKHNLPCPKCGGSDPVSTNEDGSGHCFSCGEHYGNYQASLDGNIVEMATHKEPSTFLNSYTGVFGALTDRNISETVAKKYGVRVVHDHEGKVSKHIYPYYNSNEIVSTKTRTVSTKGFTVNGGYEGTGLFGEQLFGGGGKYLTITEGECDAMAVYEIFDKKWASVSIKRGAQGAVRDVRDSIEFIESFDNVVICFDNDKYGREAARKVARIIKPGKAKIVSLPTGFKDANAFLEQVGC